MMPLTRRQLLAAAPGTILAQGGRAPNVILILTDDQGYGDLGCHGNTAIRTPNIDRLHGESVRLANFHVDPLCSPTRSALMTGRYSCRTGVWATVMGRSLLRRDEVTMANVFADSGYRTGIFGKWHLGDNYPLRPEDRGFQEVVTLGGGGVGQTPDHWGNTYFDDTYRHNGKWEKYSGYCTDAHFRNALGFIQASRNRPFFCYIPTNAPHGPYNVAKKYSEPYAKQGIASPMAEFFGMIANIDKNVGLLRQRLKEWKLEDNTILIFMTDNGTAAGNRAGMRAAKGSPYEGGHRVPCFLYWPAGGLSGGRDVAGLTAHFDLLPTLIELCALQRPAGVRFDGSSLADALRGKKAVPERTLVAQVQQRQVQGRFMMDNPEKWINSAVMRERWRLINGTELYDLKADPGQTNNVAAENTETHAHLRSAYENWWEDVSRRFGEYSEIVLGSSKENPVHLNCMDWHGEQIPWNQTMIRKTPDANGFWAVEVERAGTYEFTLRQEPAESGKAIQGSEARIEIAGAKTSAAIPPGATSVTLRAKLPAGKTRLQTWLSEKRGAFFVEVRRVDAA